MVHDVSGYCMLEDFATYTRQGYGTVISRQRTVMLACDQESGSLPVSSDFSKIICRAGARRRRRKHNGKYNTSEFAITSTSQSHTICTTKYTIFTTNI